MKVFYSLFIFLLSLPATGLRPDRKIDRNAIRFLKDEIIARADNLLTEKPVTITDFICNRSAGGKHDFYSEGDYWWPDPQNPDGPYIQRDGMTNPGNFVDHRKAVIR